MKVIQIGKEDAQLFLFTGEMIIHIKNMIESIKVARSTKWIKQVAGYKSLFKVSYS
jgi:hypothetical protein